MADEDPREVLKIIKEIYKICDFVPAKAKEYEMDDEIVELHREAHARFSFSGFKKMPKGMTGLDSGQPWFLYWLS
jgi:hypothetical protein